MDERRITELMVKRRELERFLDNNRDYLPFNPETSTDIQNERLIVYTNRILPVNLRIDEFMDEKVVNLTCRRGNR